MVDVVRERQVGRHVGAGDAAGDVGIGFHDERLLGHKQRLRTEELTRCGRVLGWDEERVHPDRPLPGQFLHPGP